MEYLLKLSCCDASRLAVAFGIAHLAISRIDDAEGYLVPWEPFAPPVRVNCALFNAEKIGAMCAAMFFNVVT